MNTLYYYYLTCVNLLINERGKRLRLEKSGEKVDVVIWLLGQEGDLVKVQRVLLLLRAIDNETFVAAKDQTESDSERTRQGNVLLVSFVHDNGLSTGLGRVSILSGPNIFAQIWWKATL